MFGYCFIGCFVYENIVGYGIFFSSVIRFRMELLGVSMVCIKMVEMVKMLFVLFLFIYGSLLVSFLDKRLREVC